MIHVREVAQWRMNERKMDKKNGHIPRRTAALVYESCGPVEREAER